MENSQVKARLIAPFPYAGGKGRIADLVWQYFGSPEIYIEPFFGSGAVLLARPDWPMQDLRVCELVNDKDGFVANFWRAVQHDPAGVIKAADMPINENEYHARHISLRQCKVDLVARLEANPDYYDDWTMVTGHGYFGLQSQNRDKEARQRHAKQDAIWFSPYCLKPDTQSVTAKTVKKPVRNRKQTSTETVMPLLF